MNRNRANHGYEPVPTSALRWRRKVVKPFETLHDGLAEDSTGEQPLVIEQVNMPPAAGSGPSDLSPTHPPALSGADVSDELRQ